MWFSGLGDIARIGISGVVAFVALLASIRLAGNRTLSSMNASDFIVTVAMGTTVATTMLSTEVSIASGVAGIVTLVAIQALTVWTSVKYPRLRHRAEGEPVLLLHDGTPHTATMERARVSMDELRQAVREKGFGGFEDLAAVVLEANGKFAVIRRSKEGEGRAMLLRADR